MTNDKSIVIFDFDNTLTTTDTIKFTVASLLLCQPWKLLHVVHCYYTHKKSKSTSETLKHSIIGYLISGKTVHAVSRCMKIYSWLTRLFFLEKCWAVLFEQLKTGKKVIIATASPFFAVNEIMKHYGIPVIGTLYHVNNDVYSGDVMMPLPFQDGKLEMVKVFMNKNGFEDIEAAYSDSLSDRPILEAAAKGFLVKSGGTIVEFMKQ